MQVFQAFENQHGRNQHAAQARNGGNPCVKRFEHINLLFALVDFVQAFVVIGFQLGGVKIVFAVDLRVACHRGGNFNFLLLIQRVKAQAMLFFIGFFLGFDGFELRGNGVVVFQYVFLDNGVQRVGHDAAEHGREHPRCGNSADFMPFHQSKRAALPVRQLPAQQHGAAHNAADDGVRGGNGQPFFGGEQQPQCRRQQRRHHNQD